MFDEVGCPKMSVQNYHSVLHNISEECRPHYLAMKTLVWFRMVRFRAIQLGVIWFGASYANLR